jgi:hypothetical protein
LLLPVDRFVLLPGTVMSQLEMRGVWFRAQRLCLSADSWIAKQVDNRDLNV